MEINYRLTITKTAPNPDFAKQMEEMEKNNRYERGMYRDRETMPMKEITTDILITEITPHQFEKIRKEVLSVF